MRPLCYLMAVRDDELRVALKPEAALRRITEAMNRPAKRLLGVKIADEYVGVVHGRQFEVWERRRHAVHLLGEVMRDQDGSRIALRTGLTLRARILIGVFFALFLVFAVGIATLPVDRAFPEATPFLAVAGGLAAAGIFSYSARAQAADLRGFVAKEFEDVRAR